MTSDSEDFRVYIDLEHAEREAHRVRSMLAALRRRHDLSPYEFTRIIQIVPAGQTYSHPILTLGTRFAGSEDELLSTYLHEQMHWYLWRYGGPDYDPVEPFFDELVRRYPKAPISRPAGGRNYEQTYIHLVVCWLEIAVTARLIGEERAYALCDTHWGYRWIYDTVRRDREALGELLTRHGLWPLKSPDELDATAPPAVRREAARKVSAARRKRPAAKRTPPTPKSRRRPPARGGRSAG